MKRTELRIRRNYHVAKRISDSTSRRYGFNIDYPTARSTVPAIIESARVLHADRRSGVSRDDVLQQHIFVPGETSRPPANWPPCYDQRDTLLLSASREPSRIRELEARDRFLPQHIRNRRSWIEDDYLFAQIGGSLHQTSCPHGEPECGRAWICDLCQEDAPTRRSQPIDEPRFESSVSDGTDDVYFNPHLFSSTRDIDCSEYFQPSLFEEREILTPHDSESPPPLLHDHIISCQPYFSTHEKPAASKSSDGLIPTHRVSSEVSSKSSSCARINLFLLIFSALVIHFGISTPAQSPGVLAVDRHILLTIRVQHYVFDRGKCC